MVEAGDVDQLGLGQLDEFAGQRIPSRHAWFGQLAQVLDDVERVRIDGIDVEQVVLHLPDDVAEFGQVASEDAVAVHTAKVAVNAFLALEQLDEQAGVAQVPAKRVVDQVAMVAQQADGVGAYATGYPDAGRAARRFPGSRTACA